jgi:GTP pyrophosphokinase
VRCSSRRAAPTRALREDPRVQTENVRKMLLAFSRDLRVVMLRLASRLQTLRYYAATKQPVQPAVAREALQVFAPLANRLGIWQVKWEMKDLAFRFLEPETYKRVARWLDEKRVEREQYVEQLRANWRAELKAQGIAAPGARPAPSTSTASSRRCAARRWTSSRCWTCAALRVIVPDVKDCYARLAWVHARFSPIIEEFDDYIAKPKANGYQSLHTVVRDAAGRPIEIQIRTQAMHEHAEHGVAAHWAVQGGGLQGLRRGQCVDGVRHQIAVLRQLLAWERDLADSAEGLFEDRI